MSSVKQLEEENERLQKELDEVIKQGDELEATLEKAIDLESQLIESIMEDIMENAFIAPKTKNGKRI